MTVDQVRFVLDWLLPEVRQEWETTRKVLEAIPPGNLEYRPDPKSRTAPEIAWHIVSTEIWFLDGLIRGEFSMTEPERPPETDTVAGMVAWYEKTAPPLMEKIKQLPVESLATPVSFFGLFNYPAIQYLNFMIVHTVHHRGQISAYLRAMGGKVPSIYGGSADEPFETPK